MRFLCALSLVVPAIAAWADPAITIEQGLSPYQVLPAGANDVAAAVLSGATTLTAQGAVEARVRGGGPQVQRWHKVGSAEGGAWNARIDAIAVGGPYTVELRIQTAEGSATTEVNHVLVGDLWVLGGQSNMQGVGNNLDITPPNPRIHVFAMNDHWRIAEEPLHRLNESRDIVHSKVEDEEKRHALVADVSNWRKGAGLGLEFATQILEATGRPIGIIPCAHGGTSMTQWDPALRDEGGASLYGAMYRRVQAAGALPSQGGRVRGMLWYQGESDANEAAAPLFPDKFDGFVQAVRRDFETPELPFYFVQIGRFTVNRDGQWWNAVQHAQLEAEYRLGHTGMVSSIDLDLDDAIHIGTPGLKILGQRLAKRVLTDVYGIKRYASGPRLAEMTWHDSPFGPQLHLRFEGVNGKLHADGRVSGFYAAVPDGNQVIYHQTLHPDQPDTIILWMMNRVPNIMLQHGRGLDPYCNVRDSAGFAVPVFGPVAVPE